MTKLNTLKIGLAALLLAPCLSSFAASYLTVTKNTSVAFPSQIELGATAIGDYQVTNNSSEIQKIYLRHLTDKGFRQIDATDANITSCSLKSGFQLGPKQSCTIRLAYSSQVKGALPATRLPTVCISPDNTGCASPMQTTSFTVTGSPTATAQLSLGGTTTLAFTPSQTTQITVTNTGSVAANNVSVNLPDNLQAFLDPTLSVTRCSSIAANNGTCTLKFTFQNYMPLSLNVSGFSMTASNAATLPLTGSVSENQLSVTGYTFTKPGTGMIVVNNAGNKDITGLSIALAAGIPGVSPVTTGACGTSLQANKSCSFIYTAASNAHGNTTATVSFTPAGSSATSRKVGLAVVNTSLSVNDGKAIVASNTNNTFYVKNTGSFDAQGLTISKQAADSWLTLNTSACPAVLGYGQSCKVTYSVASGSAASGVITATATNADSVSENFLQNASTASIQIGIEGDSDKQHLMYHAVKITNSSAQAQTINSVSAAIPTSATNITGKIELCDKDGSNCLGDAIDWYKSTCYAGAVLQPNASCDLWYKANTQHALLPDTSNDVAISVTTTPVTTNTVASPTTTSATVKMTYGNDAYFSATDDDSDVLYLLKWNGITASSGWSTVDSSSPDIPGSLISFDGDLYGYCAFSNGEDGLCTFNGNHNSNIVTVDDDVKALAVFNHKIVIGGWFDNVNDIDHTARLAQYDPANSTQPWSALGAGVSTQSGDPNNDGSYVVSIYALNNHLYVGGKFLSAAGVSGTLNIAKWDPTAAAGQGQWSALGGGASGEVSYIDAVNGQLYISGGFGNVITADGAQVDDTYESAAWDPSKQQWLSMGDAFDDPAISTLSMVHSYHTLYMLTSEVLGGPNSDAAFNLYYYDTSLFSPEWTKIDTGINTITDESNIINSILNVNNKIIVMGQFSKIAPDLSVAANSIAQYDPSATPTFSSLGQPIKGLNFDSGVVAPSVSLQMVSASRSGG